MGIFIAILKTLGLVFIATSIAIIQSLFMFALFWKDKRPVWFFPQLFHRLACLISNIKITYHGTNARYQYPNTSILYASNHTSYLDIITLGSFLRGFFVAKSDIASWPVFGFLAKLQGTIFVERRPSAAKGQKEVLLNYVRNGEHLLIFPEGTTTNGWEVYPFKSSLFGAFIDESIGKPAIIQPISITYTHLDGHIIQGDERDLISWYKPEHELIPHLWAFFKHKSLKVDITFLPPIEVKKGDDRKDLAKRCFEEVNKTHTRTLKTVS